MGSGFRVRDCFTGSGCPRLQGPFGVKLLRVEGCNVRVWFGVQGLGNSEVLKIGRTSRMEAQRSLKRIVYAAIIVWFTHP